MYRLNIISACYGTLDVTMRIRELYRQFTPPSRNPYQFKFTPTDELFGSDPIPGYRKACVVVYRVYFEGWGALDSQHSYPRVYRGLESDLALLDFNGTGLQPFTPGCPASNRYIVDASWYDRDVTDKVFALSNAANIVGIHGTLRVGVDVAHLGPDPACDLKKQLMVTYAYQGPSGVVSYSWKIATDGDTFLIPRGPPPTLQIHAANYGGKDVTAEARSLIQKPSHTWSLDLDAANAAFTDPWCGVYKSLIILYQYGNRPLELLVTWEGKSGIATLNPYVPVDPSRTRYLREGKPSRVIAIVWGIMQGRSGSLPESIYKSVEDTEVFKFDNISMGFDGWLGIKKTGVVFAHENTFKGGIYSVAAREGETGKLLDMLPVELHTRDPSSSSLSHMWVSVDKPVPQ